MYQNPIHIRNERVNLSLSRVELQLLQSLAAVNGQQLSAFLRELAMEQAKVHLAHSADTTPQLRAVNK